MGPRTGAGTETRAESQLREELIALKCRYCQCLDAKDWNALGALFTEDATLQLGPSTAAAVHGRKEIRRLLSRQLKSARTLHEARDPSITQQSPDRVRVVWAMSDEVHTPLYVLYGAGFYEDHYVREADGWKIDSVRLHRTKVDLQPKSIVMKALLGLHANGWLRRLAPGADRTLGEALHVGLRPGERP